jgi:hypothetical protein
MATVFIQERNSPEYSFTFSAIWAALSGKNLDAILGTTPENFLIENPTMV